MRIYPGHANVAIFFLGPEAEHYLMRIEGGAGCEHGLFDARDGVSLGRGNGSFDLAADRSNLTPILYVCHPPADYRRGTVKVHVRRHHGGDTAVVEFGFGADAIGTGCYKV